MNLKERIASVLVLAMCLGVLGYGIIQEWRESPQWTLIMVSQADHFIALKGEATTGPASIVLRCRADVPPPDMPPLIVTTLNEPMPWDVYLRVEPEVEKGFRKDVLLTWDGVQATGEWGRARDSSGLHPLFDAESLDFIEKLAQHETLQLEFKHGYRTAVARFDLTGDDPCESYVAHEMFL